jgi:hypothetical protein
VAEREEPQVDEPGRTEEGSRAAESEWDENEPSPHEGEAGQQESEA